VDDYEHVVAVTYALPQPKDCLVMTEAVAPGAFDPRRSRRRGSAELAAVSGGLLALAWPAIAAADPMCKSPFESAVCLVLNLVAAAFYAGPVGMLGTVAILVIGRAHRRRQPGRVAAAVLAFPIAFTTMMIAIIISDTHVGEGVAATVVVTAAYAALALRWMQTRGRRDG
jgi:hypothetical protein